jgi:hypothetical protein
MINEKDRTPVAQNMMTTCTRCKMELKHVVVFHNEAGIVEKVKCLTCGSEHKYRPDKKKIPGKTAKVKKKSPGAGRQGSSSEFEELSQKFSQKEPLPYSISGSFKAEDVIEHKTFSRGFVTSVSFQKMTVVFSSGTRALACNR